MQNNNAQGVVPGYQPLRQNGPRSNTAGKNSAQQQMANGQQPNISQSSSGNRTGAQLKYTKPESIDKPSQQYIQNSDPNITAHHAKGKGLVEKASNLVDRSDPVLKKDAMSMGASPRPGATGQVQIQSIIKSHNQGGVAGFPNFQHLNSSFNNGDTVGGRQLQMGKKSQSTNQRPIRSSRNNIQQSIKGHLNSSFDGPGTGAAKETSLANPKHMKALTHNQTPVISNFHPPAIQKHDNIGAQSSRRNARQQQITQNHPELLVSNSLDRQHIAYNYPKRNGAQQANTGREHHNPNQNSSFQQPPTDQRDSASKFMRPNTASQTRKQNGDTTPTVGQPLINFSRHNGLVPQPAAFIQSSATPGESILAQSSRNRRAQGNGSSKLPTPQSNQARGNAIQSTGNPLSMSQDKSSSQRRHKQEEFFFGTTGEKKAKASTASQVTSSHHAANGTLLPQQTGTAQQPLANAINAYTQNGGHTERGSSQNRGGAQSLDMFTRNSGVTPGSSSHLNPLTTQANHQRMTSQHQQSIPQYRKANLRDLRKSQRMQPSSKEKKIGSEGDMMAQINPLTSVELNQNIQKRQSGSNQQKQNGILQTSSISKNSQQLHAIENQVGSYKNGSHRSKEVNRSHDAKRQLLLPSNGGIGGIGTHQLMTNPLAANNNITLIPNTITPQQQNQQNLVPQGYKRRNKRPGQSLNQLQLSHQSNLTQTFADGAGPQRDQQSGSSNTTRKRVELTSIRDFNQRGNTIDLNDDNQNKRLQTERNKHSRQAQKLVGNSFDGTPQRRAPSNQSHGRGAAGGEGESHDPTNKNQSDTPKGSLSGKQQKDVQQPQNISERFNAITKFAFATSCGYQPGNPYKVNQDTYTLAPNMCGQQGFHLFVVCDGHGINGHKVSGDIKTELPRELESRLAQDQDFTQNTGSREFCERIPRYFRDAFADIHDRFINARNYDCNLSGSTVCGVLFDSLRIYCANAGDSRAVLYTQGSNGGLKVTPLSEDHKPCLPREKARVEKMGGRVNPIIGPQGQHLGPDRVWMAIEDTPGLAMSRSLGDGLAHSIGVSWEPEVKQLVLEPADKFIVIASDGVWEFLSNEQIARIVWPYYIKNSPEQAGNAIVRASAQKWKENDTVIDDITCITIFLEVD